MAGGTQKYEREIAEILERMERDEPRAERVRRQARFTLWQRWQTWQRRTTAWRGIGGRQSRQAAAWTWIGLTVAVGIMGLFLRVIFEPLGVVCGVAMVVVFFSPLLQRLSGPADPSPSNMWRGKVIDLRPRGGFLALLRYYWKRFRSGRW